VCTHIIHIYIYTHTFARTVWMVSDGCWSCWMVLDETFPNLYIQSISNMLKQLSTKHRPQKKPTYIYIYTCSHNIQKPAQQLAAQSSKPPQSLPKKPSHNLPSKSSSEQRWVVLVVSGMRHTVHKVNVHTPLSPKQLHTRDMPY
jgi:hypothetical protein